MTDSRLIKTLRAGLADAARERDFARSTAKLYYKELVRAIGDVDVLFTPSQARPDKLARTRELAGQLDGMCGAGAGGALFATACADACGGRMMSLSAMANGNGADEETAHDNDAVGVAYVTGSAADSAYESFAREGWSRTHTERLQSACNSVMCGDTDYTIIPIKNNADGRLRTFYRMMAEFDLKIVDTVTVRTSPSASAASSPTSATVYALCAASFGELPSPKHMEFSSKTDGTGASKLAEAMAALGHTVTEITSFPDSDGKAVYHFAVDLGGDARATLLYLDLFHPDHRVIGLYGTEDSE